MPKYKRLTPAELQELEKEFIDFLVVNGITADDWTKLKAKDLEKANKIIDHFSDVVWTGVLRKTQFLELRSAQEIKTFQCLEDKMILMALKIKDPAIDLSTKEGYDKVQTNMPETEMYTSEKKYKFAREEELFQMIQNGCYISDGKLFKAIAVTMAEQN